MRLEWIQRDFLWGGGTLDKKPHLMKWEMVFSIKREGGLGVKDLLLGIVPSCASGYGLFENTSDSLLRNLICLKFGVERGGWCSQLVRGAYGIGVWKEIRKECETFFPNVVFSLVNGRRLRFLKDIWCGEEALCDAFPYLPWLLTKRCWWLMFGSPQGRRGVGPLAFSKPFNDGKWRLEVYCKLFKEKGFCLTRIFDAP